MITGKRKLSFFCSFFSGDRRRQAGGASGARPAVLSKTCLIVQGDRRRQAGGASGV